MEQFGPCRVVRKLGEGGMGAVYLPQDDRLHRHVALKILPEYLAQDRSRRVRFEREARAAAMLVHPNICVDLPFIDGHKVLEALREKGIDVPTIFVSGLPGEEPEVRAFAIGAADFIRKPVKNSVLLARVSKVLRQGRHDGRRSLLRFCGYASKHDGSRG